MNALKAALKQVSKIEKLDTETQMPYAFDYVTFRGEWSLVFATDMQEAKYWRRVKVLEIARRLA